MSKIAQGVVLKKLRETTLKLQILTKEQFGFQAAHTAKHQILRIVEYASDDLIRSMMMTLAFLNIASDLGYHFFKQGSHHVA